MNFETVKLSPFHLLSERISLCYIRFNKEQTGHPADRVRSISALRHGRYGKRDRREWQWENIMSWQKRL